MATSGAGGAANNATVDTAGKTSTGAIDPTSLEFLEDQAKRYRGKIKKLQTQMSATEKVLAETERAVERASKKG